MHLMHRIWGGDGKREEAFKRKAPGGRKGNPVLPQGCMGHCFCEAVDSMDGWRARVLVPVSGGSRGPVCDLCPDQREASGSVQGVVSVLDGPIAHRPVEGLWPWSVIVIPRPPCEKFQNLTETAPPGALTGALFVRAARTQKQWRFVVRRQGIPQSPPLKDKRG